MTVEKIWVKDHVVSVSGIGYNPEGDFSVNGKPLRKGETTTLEKLLEIAALCNSAKIVPPSDKNKSWSVIGDPTDGALLVAALKYGLNIQDALAEKPIIDVLPFSFEKKRMATIHKAQDGVYVYTKGAPRNVLSVCTHILVNGKVDKLDEENLRQVENRIHEFASEGLRVIAVAYKKIETYTKGTEVEKDLILVGLCAMRDPPRLEVKEAVLKAKQAGIKTVIITGDYGPTAQYIAQEVGIVDAGKCEIVRGVDLEALSDGDIVDRVRRGNCDFCSCFP